MICDRNWTLLYGCLLALALQLDAQTSHLIGDDNIGSGRGQGLVNGKGIPPGLLNKNNGRGNNQGRGHNFYAPDYSDARNGPHESDFRTFTDEQDAGTTSSDASNLIDAQDAGTAPIDVIRINGKENGKGHGLGKANSGNNQGRGHNEGKENNQGRGDNQDSASNRGNGNSQGRGTNQGKKNSQDSGKGKINEHVKVDARNEQGAIQKAVTDFHTSAEVKDAITTSSDVNGINEEQDARTTASVVSSINEEQDARTTASVVSSINEEQDARTTASVVSSINGVCRRQINGFYNLAQRSSAITTGSVRSVGLRFAQDFRDLCTDVALRKFRTTDGNCNHPKNWGTSFKPVSRLLPADYSDGTGSPRTTSVNGSPLPSPRAVSRYVHPARTDLIARTIMIMQWGQWLDHDVTGFPVASELDNSIRCCGPNGTLPAFNTDPNCFPITLPKDEDNFLGKCMEFVRSIPATDNNGCALQPREQVNSLTSFIDASQVYGSTEETAEKVRDRRGGFLLKTKNGDFLPEDVNSGCILRPGPSDYCFLAGDVRVNEHPALGSMHTIWMRLHNKIASNLKTLRPADSDDDVYQLTRKIVGALIQVITYNEWLPIILGRQATELRLVSRAGRTKRQAGVDPRILNEFSTAAMRFGHSFIPEAFPIGDRRVPLRELFNRPAEVFDNFDEVVAGIAGVGTPGNRNAQKMDRNFVTEITNHLFEPLSGPAGRGLDLIALNIQRARDHGIPPYTAYRAFCGLRPLTGFNDVDALGPNVAQLARAYSSVDDIDLFTGLVHEPPEPGSNALVGPTLSCILGTQFYNLKFGDRFFFDTEEQVIAFTNDQLASLRNTTLAKVICATTKIPELPNNVFSFPSKGNPLVPCPELEASGLHISLFA